MDWEWPVPVAESFLSNLATLPTVPGSKQLCFLALHASLAAREEEIVHQSMNLLASPPLTKMHY
ncbi:MAG: hypothetical protein E6J33_02210 [Chloroflexi bacterium]|nr:MAG: hypothetical protein E6J33_02210 [Chloroflexota bacterium]